MMSMGMGMPMGMPGGMPMGSMMPMMPMGMPGKGEEQFMNITPEAMAALEQEIREEEKAAKTAAKEAGSYVGLMARYIDDEGFGFISCPECKAAWDKTDIFLSGRNYVASGVEVGDMVTFQVEKDGKDLPRAVNPKTLKELTGLRRKLAKMRDMAKANGFNPVANSLQRHESPGMWPDPKRAKLGA